MKIVPLYVVPQHEQQVTEWLWQAFGTPDSRDFFASIITTSQREGEMPLTFVAVEGEKLVGTVGLWRCDLISRQDLYPWLAALYIDENQRRHGLGAKLQQHVIEHVRELGYPQLYLYSACKGYYERFGWQYIGDGLDYPNTPVHLYQFTL